VRAKPFHFVSTIGLALAVGTTKQPASCAESDCLDDWESLIGGYNQSKWVAEKLTFAAGERGLPVSVYRPGRVTGDSRTGRAADGDGFARILKGSIRLRKVLAEGDVDDFNLSPVDYVARSIVALSRMADAPGRTYHIYNPHRVPLSRVWEWTRSFGYELEAADYPSWRAALFAQGEANELHPITPLLPDPVEIERAIREAGEQPAAAPPGFPDIQCDATVRALLQAEIRWPAVDERMFHAMLGHFVEKGLEQP
jgi:thioester reductase-like protein